MREQLEQRLEQLRAELAKGEQALHQLDRQRAQTAVVMERIRGAIIEFELLVQQIELSNRELPKSDVEARPEVDD